MEKKPQVMIRFKAGDHAIFDLKSHEEFIALANEMTRWFNCWMFIGDNAVIQKNDIERIFYFPEGYAKNRQSGVSQN